MDEREFVQSRLASWRRLADILRKVKQSGSLRALTAEEVRDLGPLYRRAASDLAYARSHAVSPGLTQGLNHLVARAYMLLYQTDARSWQGIAYFFAVDVPAVFRRRLRFFVAAVACLLLGGAVGWWLVARVPSNMDIFVPLGHPLRESVDAWVEGTAGRPRDDAQSAQFASLLMVNNIRVSLLAFALGIAGGALTAGLLFYNGAVIGGLAALVAQAGQSYHLWTSILPHGVLELSATCVAGAGGLALGWSLLAPGRYRRRDALVMAARDTVRLVILAAVVLVFCGLVEAFFSHSAVSPAAKLLFGVLSGVAFYAYLIWSGRAPGQGNQVV